jgi:hypothetical protein
MSWLLKIVESVINIWTWLSLSKSGMFLTGWCQGKEMREGSEFTGDWLALCQRYMSITRRYTGYPNWGYSWSSSVPPGKFWDSVQIRPRPLPFTSSEIHYSLITIPLFAADKVVIDTWTEQLHWVSDCSASMWSLSLVPTARPVLRL